MGNHNFIILHILGQFKSCTIVITGKSTATFVTSQQPHLLEVKLLVYILSLNTTKFKEKHLDKHIIWHVKGYASCRTNQLIFHRKLFQTIPAYILQPNQITFQLPMKCYKSTIRHYLNVGKRRQYERFKKRTI